MHVPLHAPAQQMPSSQTPDWHCAESAHAPPAATCEMHAPLGPQYLPPVHVSGSGPFTTELHAPVPGAHVWQVPPHVLAQQ
jgi:hypothetical protein